MRSSVDVKYFEPETESKQSWTRSHGNASLVVTLLVLCSLHILLFPHFSFLTRTKGEAQGDDEGRMISLFWSSWVAYISSLARANGTWRGGFLLDGDFQLLFHALWGEFCLNLIHLWRRHLYNPLTSLLRFLPLFLTSYLKTCHTDFNTSISTIHTCLYDFVVKAFQFVDTSTPWGRLNFPIVLFQSAISHVRNKLFDQNHAIVTILFGPKVKRLCYCHLSDLQCVLL